MKKHLISAAVLLAVSPAFAQAPLAGPAGPGGPGGGPGAHAPFGGPGMFRMRQPVTNAPYSATFTSSSTEKLQDGTVLSHNSTRSVARDSLGRTWEQVTLPARGQNSQARTEVTILDPVAHTITRLDADKKIAVVRQIPDPPKHGWRGAGGPPPQPPAADQAGGTPSQGGPGRGPHENKNVAVADLGSKTIDGVVATGKRITRTIPANTVGNTTPIITTHEDWFEPDLKIELSRSDVDPFRGTSTTAVSSLTKAEPDASLFKVPEGYTVQQAPDRAGRRGPGGPGGFHRGGPGAPPPPAGM